jgi:hypothetical protein
MLPASSPWVGHLHGPRKPSRVESFERRLGGRLHGSTFLAFALMPGLLVRLDLLLVELLEVRRLALSAY